MHTHAISHSVVSNSANAGTIARQSPLCMGFSRQEYWSRLTIPSPEALPAPGMEPAAPALAEGFFTTEPPGKPQLARRAGLWCGSGSSGESSCFFRAEFISRLVVWTCLAAALHAGLCLLRGGILSHHPILGLCSQCHLLSLFCRLRVSWALLGRSAPLCTLGSSLQGSFTVEGRAVGGSPENTSPGDGRQSHRLPRARCPGATAHALLLELI